MLDEFFKKLKSKNTKINLPYPVKRYSKAVLNKRLQGKTTQANKVWDKLYSFGF